LIDDQHVVDSDGGKLMPSVDHLPATVAQERILVQARLEFYTLALEKAKPGFAESPVVKPSHSSLQRLRAMLSGADR
jgi:hypothetical protein